jgi:hypothetical protein
MGRKLPQGFLHRKDLESVLKDNNVSFNKKIGKNELLLVAFEKELIDYETFNCSLNKRTSTISCYLYTHIQDSNIQKRLEEYVKVYSMLYTRGSWLANLACIMISKDNTITEHFPTNNDIISIPTFLKNENLVKHAFLPERWLLKDKPIDQTIFNAYKTYKETLSHFLPNYKAIMVDSGWDNALNHMGTSYLGNVKTQICTHLPSRLKSYVIDKHLTQEDTNKQSLWFAINAPLSPNSSIHNDDFEWAMTVRTSLKLSNEDWFNRPEELDDYRWTLHLWLLKQFDENEKASRSYLPVSTLNRKYAYIDEKVAGSLIPSRYVKEMLSHTETHFGSKLQKMFGLTKQLFNKRRLKIRKQLKAKYKDNKKLKKKWSKNGHSCFPVDATVKMFKTDGVGLRLCVEFIPKIKEIRAPKIKNDAMFENPFKIGVDTGRVRILTCAKDDGEVKTISRKAFYRAQRSRFTEKYEKERKTNTDWGRATSKMSAAGGFKNGHLETWERTLEACKEEKDHIVEELVNNKTRSLMAMRRYRWKKAFFDRNFKRIFDKTIKDKQPTVFGLGDGDFSCTGRGERAVPTKDIENKLRRFLKMHQVDELVKIKRVNEYNTTKCCYKCHSVMMKLTTKFGKECLRYRLCTECTKPTDKRRNRDVNASKNIKFLIGLELEGKPRPEIFQKPERSKKHTTQGYPS